MGVGVAADLSPTVYVLYDVTGARIDWSLLVTGSCGTITVGLEAMSVRPV